jgi:hypothetical protein
VGLNDVRENRNASRPRVAADLCQEENFSSPLTHTPESYYTSFSMPTRPTQFGKIDVVVFSHSQCSRSASSAAFGQPHNSLFRNILPATPWGSRFYRRSARSNPANCQKLRILAEKYFIF